MDFPIWKTIEVGRKIPDLLKEVGMEEPKYEGVGRDSSWWEGKMIEREALRILVFWAEKYKKNEDLNLCVATSEQILGKVYRSSFPDPLSCSYASVCPPEEVIKKIESAKGWYTLCGGEVALQLLLQKTDEAVNLAMKPHGNSQYVLSMNSGIATREHWLSEKMIKYPLIARSIDYLYSPNTKWVFVKSRS